MQQTFLWSSSTGPLDNVCNYNACQNFTQSLIPIIFFKILFLNNFIYIHHYTYFRFIGFGSYYGHASNTSNLGESMHMSFIFAALVELPCIPIPVIINVVGRRWSLFTLFLLAGTACIAYAIVPPG